MRGLKLSSILETNRQLGRAEPKLLYKDITLDVLQLYFLTGFLANYVGLVRVNNAILVFLAFAVFLKARATGLFSPLIIIYAILTALSLINHFRWLPEAGLPQGARTMPIVLLAMIACRACARRGLFERVVAVNALPLLLLMPIGAHIGVLGGVGMAGRQRVK